MIRADGLHAGLNGDGGPLLHVLCGTRPLGGVVVHQLSDPVSKPDLDISVQGSHGQLLDIQTQSSTHSKQCTPNNVEKLGVSYTYVHVFVVNAVHLFM